MPDVETAKEAMKEASRATGFWESAAASFIAGIAGYLAWIRRRGDLATRALHAATAAKEAVEKIREDLHTVDRRTRRMKTSMVQLAQQWKWWVEQAAAERENMNAKLDLLFKQQAETHEVALRTQTIIEERAKMRTERLLRTRATDPLTPVPGSLGDE